MTSEQANNNEQAETTTSSLKTEENVIPDCLDKEYLASGQYLCSLRDRLSQCAQRNNHVIDESVKLLKELSDVSDGMHLPISTSTNTSKIKNLIRNFETIGTANATNLGLDMDVGQVHGLFFELKKLNEDSSLRDCLMTFKSAKEKFEKVQSSLENMGSTTATKVPSAGTNVPSAATSVPSAATSVPSAATSVPSAITSIPSTATSEHTPPAPQTNKLSPSNSVSPTNSVSLSLRDKIVAFNKALGDGKDSSKYFVDCFSSRDPMTDTSAEELKLEINGWSRTQSGYEGDIDSEVEQADSTRGQVE